MAVVCLIEEEDQAMEILIRRAVVLLSFGLSEHEVRDIMFAAGGVTEMELFFAIRAAEILRT